MYGISEYVNLVSLNLSSIMDILSQRVDSEPDEEIRDKIQVILDYTRLTGSQYLVLTDEYESQTRESMQTMSQVFSEEPDSDQILVDTASLIEESALVLRDLSASADELRLRVEV